ncbi:MAG TPA: CoA transferase [Gammaproteobacteria bacterium]|nr:CoA transferase [Gammaproteobacteria bacterium]
MLSSYKVLDLSNQQGMFCGYILAHLGAEVTVVEPPAGSPVHQIPPFVGDNGDSLWWQAYSRGKKSLSLDLESVAGRNRLNELMADADFLIESFSNREVKRLGIDYQSVAVTNPRLIVVSITPFGRTGPKADWPATDLTVWAAGGAHILAGDNDRAPVRTSVPQSFLHAGADAAGAALIALQERHKSGLGQHIDVSAQQSSAQASLSAILATPNNSAITVQRAAGGLAGIIPAQLTWPCKDGYVAITFLFGPAFNGPNRRLLTWVQESGACTEQDVAVEWGERLAAMARGEAEPDAYFEICKKIESFTLQHTQQALFDEGIRRGLYIAPTFDIEKLLAEPHFQARNFWHRIEIEPNSLKLKHAIRAPGAFAKFSASPMTLPGAAPTRKSAGTMNPARKRGPSASGSSQSNTLPLAGLKVLDFMWVIAGPLFTRVLSDYGATVIKVESTKHVEPARAAPTFKNDDAGIEMGVPFANFNAGKLGVTIDPSIPQGREVILDLVRWADVVTESFSPKAMKAWGLDYETLKQINPNIIMISSCLMGQTGPRAQVPGYGNMAAAIAGFYDLTGWPDRSPAGPYLAYTDGVAPRFMLASLLAAMEHQRKTGEGQYIDISQAEAAIHFLAPAILDHEINQRAWQRMGNRDLQFCPHGVYPAKGEDRWIAIACQSDAAWQSLCDVAGFTDAAADKSLLDSDNRHSRADELDELISTWTISRPADEIQQHLIEAGVAAHVVQNSPECMRDPQLNHREHFVSVPHNSVGDFVIEGTRFKLSRTPGRSLRANPELGEHNVHVLTEILGYDVDQMADVFASLAME